MLPQVHRQLRGILKLLMAHNAINWLPAVFFLRGIQLFDQNLLHNRRGLYATVASTGTGLVQCSVPKLIFVNLHVALVLLAGAKYLLADLACVVGTTSGGHLEAVDTSAVDRWRDNLERLRFRFDYMTPGRYDVPVVRGCSRVGAVLDLIIMRIQMRRESGHTVEALGTDLALVLRG